MLPSPPKRGHLAISGKILGCHNWSEVSSGIRWAEVRDAAKHPTVHGAAPTTKNYLAPNVSHAGIEKPCSKKPVG